MMMVRCHLGPSSIEGLGVFSEINIRKGALVWIFDPRFDMSYDREELDRTPGHFREFLERYTYSHPTDPDRVVLDCDEGRFMNHADDANVIFPEPFRGVARTDIPAGVEMTCDYREFTLGPLLFQPPRHRVVRAPVLAE